MQSAASATRDAPAPAWPRRRRLILALVILTIALSATVRFASLNAFPGHVFDEYYYAHDAAALLRGDLGPRGAESWRPGEARSIAHPELGTLAIAAGVALLGDGPGRFRHHAHRRSAPRRARHVRCARLGGVHLLRPARHRIDALRALGA